MFYLCSIIWIKIINQNIESFNFAESSENKTSETQSNSYARNCDTEKNDKSALMFNPYLKHQQTHLNKANKAQSNDTSSSFSNFSGYIKKKVNSMMFDNSRTDIESIRERHEQTFSREPEQLESCSEKEIASGNILENL